MSPYELDWLYETAKGMKSIVEVGSWKGKSTFALCLGCPGTVYAVDHFKGSRDERDKNHKEALTTNIFEVFLENVGHFKNLKTWKMDSLQAAGYFDDKSVDMVFIDAGHTYKEVRDDLRAWMPKAVKLLCGHDGDESSPVRKVLNDFNVNYEIIAGTIWQVKL